MNTAATTSTEQPTPRKAVGEWFWRFLGAAMLFAVAWVLWIAYQLNPTPLATAAAFEAAEKAKASQTATGVIKPAADEAKAEPKPEEPKAEAPKEQKEPPVNVEKLKLSDSITVPPAPEAKRN